MNHPTYSHFAKPADVWKHLALCEILANEHPSVYVDTNAACAEYTLSLTPEQQYGIYHFMLKSHGSLLQSAYYKLEYPVMRENKYLGSPGLAMTTAGVLGYRADRFVFYDLERAALENISMFAYRHSLTHKVRTIQQDSIAGMCDLLPELPHSTLVHIDPYAIDRPSKNGCDYLDVFVRAAGQGLKCLLWYGFNTLEEKKQLNEFVKNKLSGASVGHVSCIELIMDVIQEHTILCNPGILGNGLLTCNLSGKSTDALLKYSEELVELYKNSRYKDFSGSIYRDVIL